MSARTLGVLGSADGYYVRDLQRACTELNVDCHVFSFGDLQTFIGWGQSRAQVTANDLRPLELDSLIVRTMPLGSLEQVIFRMDCLQVLQARGTQVINSPRCLEISIDKWLTLHRLAEAGLPVPATVACQTRDQALDAFDRLDRDVLVKPLFGGEGRGIIRLQDEDLAWRTLSTLHQLGQVLYLQQFIENFGYDIRVLLIGHQMYSIRRHAPLGSYRSNVSMGGSAAEHQLTEQERELALLAAKSVEGHVVGVDLLPARDGQTYVLEVNAVPGWRGLASCLQIDIAKQIVRLATTATSHPCA